MRRLAIDFSGRMPLGRRLYWVLLGVGFISLLPMIWQYEVLRQKVEALEAEKLSLLQHAKGPLTNSESEKGKLELEARLKYAESVARKLIAPWDDLLLAFERAQNKDIALLDLEIDQDSGAIQFTAVAHDVSSMFSYLQCLQELDVLADPFIENHQDQPEDAQWPVRFQGKAKWVQRPNLNVALDGNEKAKILNAGCPSAAGAKVEAE